MLSHYFRVAVLLIAISFLLVLPPNLLASTSKTLTFSLNDVSFDTSDGYDTVKMPESSRTDELAKPDLPCYYYQFIIPNNMDVSSVQITSSNYSNVSGYYDILPTQEDIPTLAGATPPAFVDPDSATYNTSSYYPGILSECVRMGFFDGGNKIATIAVYPLQYNPVSDRLVLYTSISINLQFTGSSESPIYADIRSSWGIKLYQDALEAIVINPEDISTYGYTPTVNNDPYQQTDDLYWYPFTIITSASKASWYDNFVEWQRMKGIYAGVVTTEDIYAEYTGDLVSGIYDNPGKIRQYLKDGFDHYNLQFALLGGDENTVPPRICSPYNYGTTTIPADVYFTDFNGDWDVDSDGRYGEIEDDDVDFDPEIFVGRITANSSAPVTKWFNKVKKYDTLPDSRDHLLRMLWTQSDQMQNQQQIQNYFTSTTWYSGTGLYSTIIEEYQEGYSGAAGGYAPAPTYPTGEDVIDELNNSEYGWLSAYNHGSGVGYSVRTNSCNGGGDKIVFSCNDYNPAWGNSSFEYMTNSDDVYPILYSISCSGGKYDNPDGSIPITEGWTIDNIHGGPAAMGNTRNGYLSTSPSHHAAFLQLIFDDNENVVGESFGLAKLSTSGYSWYKINMSITLFGSPSMYVWNTTPQEFTDISHPLSIPEGGDDSFTVEADVVDATVCIYQEDDGFFEEGLTDANGDITFDIDLSSNYRLWVTADRYDHIVYQWSMIPGLPAPPQDVTLTANQDDHPVISWDANTEPNLDGYNVYRKVYIPNTQSVYEKQNTGLITTTSWTDEGFGINPNGGATAYYYVTAVDDDPDESEASETVSTQGVQMTESSEAEGIAALILNDFAGLMASPNPFNEQVSIKFVAVQTGKVNVSVYNIRGQKVAELFDGIAAANRLNTRTFNASALSSGVYFCRMIAGDNVTNRKLVYLK